MPQAPCVSRDAAGEMSSSAGGWGRPGLAWGCGCPVSCRNPRADPLGERAGPPLEHRARRGSPGAPPRGLRHLYPLGGPGGGASCRLCAGAGATPMTGTSPRPTPVVLAPLPSKDGTASPRGPRWLPPLLSGAAGSFLPCAHQGLFMWQTTLVGTQKGPAASG